jgi:hypothetical protein
MGCQYKLEIARVTPLRDDRARVHALGDQRCETSSCVHNGPAPRLFEPLRRGGEFHLGGRMKAKALGVREHLDHFIGENRGLAQRPTDDDASAPPGVDADAQCAMHARTLAHRNLDKATAYLVLKESETRIVRDPTWEDYERDRDAQALAEKHSQFFRAVFIPTLASALNRVRAGDAAASRAFADRLTHGLKRRLEAEPAHMHSLVQILVVTKVPE